MGVSVLVGCGDDSDPSDARSSRSASWRRADVTPLTVSDAPAGRPSWFRRPPGNGATVEPVKVKLTPIHEERIEPSDEDVTITAGDAEVVIPAGAIDRPAPLTIARATRPAALPVEGLQAVDTWAVSLGERHVFAKPLTLRFPLPVGFADQARRRDRPLAAMYYNPEAKAWVSMPVAFDTDTGRAEIRTRHLTLMTIALRPVNSLVHDAVYTDHFAIFYSKEDILADTEAGEKIWAKKLIADLKKHGEPVGVARQVDAQTIEVAGRSDVPTYIVYMAKALEYAWARYKDQGLDVPEWTRTDIYVGVNSPLSDSNHRGKLLGTIEITPTSTWRPTTMRTATAHEFFHTVQAEYLGLAIMSMNYRTWWLEALAEFAPRTVWGTTAPQKGMKADFFHLPLTTVDESHEYGCSQFVRFLVTAKGIDFARLTTETLDVPAGILAMEEASAPNFAVFKKALGIDGPFDDYGTAATCGVVDRFLRKRGTTLGDAYAEFAAWTMFDSRCRSLVNDGDELLRFAAGHATLGGLALNDEKVEQTLRTKPHGTASVWAVAVQNPTASESDPKPPRKVTVKADGPVPLPMRLCVYVLKNNRRISGGLKPAGVLRGDDASVDVAVGAEDMLYVVASNTSNAAADATVQVLGGLDFRIEPAAVDPLDPHEEMTFKAVSDSLPQTILPSRLKVRWRPVRGVEELTPADAVGAGIASSYTYAWRFKGDYVLRAELLDDATPIATARLPVEVVAGNEPSITLEAQSITVPAGRQFSVSATTQNAPKGATYRWKAGHGKTQVTDSPSCTFTLSTAGEYDIEVTLLDADGRPIAGDEGSLTAEPGKDRVWIIDKTTVDGEEVVARKYQVLRGTYTKDGSWLHYYTQGRGAGELKQRKTFENNVCRKSETFHRTGQVQQVEHFDADGKRHGERAMYWSDGRRALLETYAHGVKHGPYEQVYSTGNTYTRHSGRYVEGELSGTRTLYSGNKKTGSEYVWKTGEFFNGEKHGTHVTYLRDGRKKGEAEYRNGELHGWSRSWYTSELDEGKYYLMSETRYENGDPVRTRHYNSRGEVTSDKPVER
ncbi:MAG: PKD domain-containing protein [Phycisphaerae bacterium]|nr:PKD domain-containing protein [Phycisphaerae bacterium]